MKAVWKSQMYGSDSTFSLPRDAEVVHVALQDWNVCIWTLVDPERECVPRKFRHVNTGVPCIFDEWKYLGTVHYLAWGEVWHVFEVPA